MMLGNLTLSDISFVMSSELKKYHSLEEDEFRLLFQHNFFNMLKIFCFENPTRKLYKNNTYETSVEIKEKIGDIFNFRLPSVPPPHDYFINIKLEKEVKTLSDLNKYIEELEGKANNYKIALIAGESLKQSIDKFLNRLQNFMASRGLIHHAKDVVEVISRLVAIAEFNEYEKLNFYRALANSKLSKQRFYDILSTTCVEYIKSQNFDPDFIKKAKCDCPYEETDSCEKYPRKSIALHYAYKRLQTLNPTGEKTMLLSVDRCVSSGASFHFWIQAVD